MFRTIVLDLFLTVMAVSTSQVKKAGKPCCLPEQFTCSAMNMTSRGWSKAYVDLKNQRKLVLESNPTDWMFIDYKTGTTYNSVGGVCTYKSTDHYGIQRSCPPPGTELDEDAGSNIGGSLPVYTWKMKTARVEGTITVTQDNCWPVATSLTDLDTGNSLYITYADVTVGVDASVFNVDLSGCTPAL